MIGIFFPFKAAAVSMMADNWGIPAPATMRVVQIEPGPMPTFTQSAPASAKAFAPAAVATFPAIIFSCLKFLRKACNAVITPLEWPWALSSVTTSTPTCCKAAARSIKSLVIPKAAPTNNLPNPSLPAFGKLRNCKISRYVINPINLPRLLTTGNFSIL